VEHEGTSYECDEECSGGSVRVGNELSPDNCEPYNQHCYDLKAKYAREAKKNAKENKTTVFTASNLSHLIAEAPPLIGVSIPFTQKHNPIY
jgi:hypothetical protein